MTTVFLVEHNMDTLEAFTRKEGAQARVLELVRDSFHTTGLNEEEVGIDFDRLAGEHSTPEDWEELSVQWNEFWDNEPDMQILIYEIPLS